MVYDIIWLVPISIIVILGLFFIRRALRNPKGSHDRSEIMSGVGILLLSAGALKIAIDLDDIIASLLILIGSFVAIIYGIEHLLVRREERKGRR